MLIDVIQEAKQGEQAQMLYLLEKFRPILSKYARKLGTEDAFDEMQLQFIEIITFMNIGKLNNKGDGAVVNYLANSVFHAYTKIVKYKIAQGAPMISIEELTERNMFSIHAVSEPPSHKDELPSFPPRLLSPKEESILRLVYECGYSAADLAKTLGTTRQNINQIKKHAEDKVKRWYIPD